MFKMMLEQIIDPEPYVVTQLYDAISYNMFASACPDVIIIIIIIIVMYIYKKNIEKNPQTLTPCFEAIKYL